MSLSDKNIVILNPADDSRVEHSSVDDVTFSHLVGDKIKLGLSQKQLKELENN